MLDEMTTAAATRQRLLLLAAVLALAACSKDIEGPKPTIDPPSADAAPPPVDPELICRDQGPSKVTLHGEHFTAIPADIPNDPTLALPNVKLSRAHELDGSEVPSPDVVVYSGSPKDDPSNAVDENGELILVEGAPLLSWDGQAQMSFLVTQDLVLGELPKKGKDTRAHGMLEPGVWDVEVEAQNGHAATSAASLAVIDKPTIEKLSPGIVCLEQGQRTITLTGQSFLRNAADKTQLAVEGVAAPFAAELGDCSAIAHVGLDAEICKTATVKLPMDSVAPGYPGLTLQNPATAACKSEDQVALRVVPAPSIDRVVEALACIDDGARDFVIEGQDFLRVDGTTVPTVTVGDTDFAVTDMACAAALPAGEHMVEPCTSITIRVMPGELDAGLYDVSVVNPDNPDFAENGEPKGCSSVAMGALRIVPAPKIDALEPSYVCLEDGTQDVTVHGSGFLVIDGAAPSVVINGEPLAANAVDTASCDPLDVAGLGVETCSSLVLHLPQNGVDLGNPTLVVTNAAPAGCMDEAMDAWTVLARPTLTSATPEPICNAQAARSVTLTGSGFLELAGATTVVTIGGVAATSVVATAASCTAIPGRTDGKSCTELVATFAQGALAAGQHDVIVADAAGCTTQEPVTLVVVDAPTVASVAPSPICLSQTGVDVTITGTGFLRVGTSEPSVTIGGVAATNVVTSSASCTAVAGTLDTVSCTELTATLAMAALADGTVNPVVVTNPAPADCASQEAVDLTVVPPPTIASVDSANVCTGGGTIAITGTNLAGITARLVDPDTQGVIDALNTVVDGGGTQATITFGSGVQPDTYDLVIANANGCGDTATQQIVAISGPVVFFLDPPVAYNGVSLRATLYASGVTTQPTDVILTPQGGGTVADQVPLTGIAWPSSSSNNKIGATIPQGVDEGTYDVLVDFGSTGCDAVLAAGLTVEMDVTLALLTPALTPQFGQENTAIAVNVAAKATADLATGEVNFQPTPRAYLSSATLATAEPLRAVAFDDEERLTAIVPDTLPAGSYDLVVVNPDGSVGFQAGAYEATVVAPPAIDDVTPTQLDNDIARPITITGTGFFDPKVELLCIDGGATTPTTLPALTIAGGATDTTLVATVPSGISHGSICVVRVTNTTNATWDEFSAITVTNPASKLPAFRSGSSLVDGRRAPATTLGIATREARFLYAIGGDDGDPQNAKTSIEAAPIERFGDVGAWRTIESALPEGVTLAHAVSGGRYVYLFGGMINGATSSAIARAQVLDPDAAPIITNVDLGFYSTADSDPQTRDGLAPGAFTYVIAAVFDNADADNPGGESLRSEPLTLYAPDVPDGVEVTLSWAPVFGADTVTEAVAYRIYRTTSANSPVSELRLLDEVAAPTHTYVDKNPATFLDDTKLPLSVGDLGEWDTAFAQLNTARASYGVALANDTGCTPYVYVVGGQAGASSESASYEYATFDPATGALGGFTQAAGSGLSARRELASFVADDQTSAQINPGGGCESYLYASYGRTGTSSFVTNVQKAQVQAGGALGAFSDAGPSPQNVAGHAAFFSSDGAYVMAGASNSADAVNTAVQAAMCSGSGCTAPDLKNFSSASNSLLEARYLPGFARKGAFFYLIGGADANGDPLATTESNVR